MAHAILRARARRVANNFDNGLPCGFRPPGLRTSLKRVPNSMKDHTLSSAMEEDGAKKSGGTAVHLQTCHVAMLQEPEKVADLITEAAKGSVKTATK